MICACVVLHDVTVLAAASLLFTTASTPVRQYQTCWQHCPHYSGQVVLLAVLDALSFHAAVHLLLCMYLNHENAGGVFIGTTVDSEVLRHRANRSSSEVARKTNLKFGNECYSVSMSEYPDSTLHWGCQYSFSLEASVQDCEEYMVYIAKSVLCDKRSKHSLCLGILCCLLCTAAQSC